MEDGHSSLQSSHSLTMTEAPQQEHERESEHEHEHEHERKHERKHKHDLLHQQQRQHYPNHHVAPSTPTRQSIPIPRALHRRAPSLSNYAATSISKHYAVNQQILAAFESHYDAKYYRVAYAMGLQFVETALLEIPKHGYFYSPRHETERMASSLEAVRVTSLLQQIQNGLGQEYNADLERVQRLHALAVTQVEQASEDQYETQRRKAEQELRASSSNFADWVVLDNLVPTCDSLTSLVCPTSLHASNNNINNNNNSINSSPETIPLEPPEQPTTRTTRDDHVDLLRGLPQASLPLVKSPTEPSRRTAFLLPETEADLNMTVDIEIDNDSANALPAPPPAPIRRRQASWSIPPAALANDELVPSWGLPPPLVAQENTTIVTTPTAEPTPNKRPHRPSMGNDALPPRPPNRQGKSSLGTMVVDDTTTSWTMVPSPSSTPPPPPSLQYHHHHHHVRQDSFSSLVSQQLGGVHSRTNTAEQIMLERALFLSGLEVVDATTAPVPATNKLVDDDDKNDVERNITKEKAPALRLSTSSKLEFSTLQALYHEDFDHLVKTKRIRVTTAPTYQGRLPSSTNGCTVIAPLLCMHHLLNNDDDGEQATATTTPDAGVPDTGICQVIDEETPVILGDLRSRLGLSDQAFLIPSDVHDYLIENGQLHQSQFVNVVGGNLLQDTHVDNFVSALADVNIPKLAATLFFHEHVICILKLNRGDGNFWYDVIDSLPLPQTLQHGDESDASFWQRFGIAPDDPRLTQVLVPFTVRLRCLDEESLQACLRWYACSKFTEENIRYIDQYDWEEAQSDFDPRVFQAFLWGRAQ